MGRLIDADKLKLHYAWWGEDSDKRRTFDCIVDVQPTAGPEWIPCSERLPDKVEPVNITWVNRDPAPYYIGIKDIPQVATGYCYNGTWYWFSAICEDYLNEYGKDAFDEIDAAVEILAWMPLPEPYKEGE